ncbi:hypothetical protein ACGFNU_23255 [Spirillospora sp. NPDC048911]|uniref:hypothetical protein n=1 Tax=Spirillospora sp. NPDC048911 TaxID=3364527 RepID=UPI00371449B6
MSRAGRSLVILSAATALTAGLAAPAVASTSGDIAQAQIKAEKRRPYNAGNKYGDSRGSVIWNDNKSFLPNYLAIEGKVRDFPGTSSATYVYLSFDVGKGKKWKHENKKVATVYNGRTKSFKVSYFFKNKKWAKNAKVTVCTKAGKKWACGRPG